MRTSPAGHAAAEVALLDLTEQIVDAVAADERTHAEIAYAAGMTEGELDGLLAQDRLDLSQVMTIAQGLTAVGTITFATTFAPNISVPTLTGTAQVGQVLSASVATTTGSPTPTLTYQWERLTALGVYEADITDGAVVITVATPGVTAVDEVQSVTITGSPTGGDFTLTFDGQTTSAIAFDAAAATVQTELRALSSINGANVTVTGSAGGPYTVTFIGTLAGTNVSAMTANGAGLTGGTAPDVAIATDTPGVAAVAEVVTIKVVGESGTYTLTYGGQTTAALDPDATADEVELALLALSSVAEGDITSVTRSGSAFPYTYTVTFAASEGNVGAITAGVGSLAGGTGPQLVVPAAAEAKKVRCEVTATNSEGTDVETSAASGVIAA